FVKTDESQQAGIVQKLSDQALIYNGNHFHKEMFSKNLSLSTEYSGSRQVSLLSACSRHRDDMGLYMLGSRHTGYARDISDQPLFCLYCFFACPACMGGKQTGKHMHDRWVRHSREYGWPLWGPSSFRIAQCNAAGRGVPV
ncbi:MAG: hypothetical protein ABF504_14345, partial [Komagataeibacter saccharivorans]|uniref:hypothetical protein n=1 Tax=Komagataeibacter saccharivorans TaxID=265959 RepID=UPI0039EA5A34